MCTKSLCRMLFLPQATIQSFENTNNTAKFQNTLYNSINFIALIPVVLNFHFLT